jgi:hypothetical protein
MFSHGHEADMAARAGGQIMPDERQTRQKMDAIDAEVARQVKRLGLILVALMILAVLALVLMVGHILEIPWLSHSLQGSNP